MFNSIVFDNAGTILRRVSALLEMDTKNIIYETNTIGIASQNDNILVVLQTPTEELIKHNCKIVDYLKKYPNQFEISYSSQDITKEDVVNSLKNDNTTFKEIKISAKALINKYDIEICSGSALIIDINSKKINYVYTAGGLFFKDTLKLIDSLKKLSFDIYIASGDNKNSLLKIASILNIDKNNIFDTCNSKCKQQVITSLQSDGNFVYMVGNNLNDILAIKKADVGILTLEQKEELPNYLINEADYIINSIYEVLKIVNDEV
ncbi:MAG: HAD family hydrolase [Methanosphaera stadtmanae]|nr:HAD family hydrolase [Methanosphaera stadtmanae]